MAARRPDETHRVATPLELFFDLVFVVAVATAARDLHHGLAERHASDAVLGYLIAFFGIWRAWVGFTWFASAYDSDDVLYRLLAFVQMTGALIFASGVSALADRELLVPVSGYVVMRVALAIQWLRVAAGDPERRPTALRYATGVLVLQAGWIGLLFLPDDAVGVGLALAIAGELAVPVWAETTRPTPWHPHHIAERHGLFTLIVLGESVYAATVSIGMALASHSLGTMMPLIAGGVLILYSMWWLYFDDESHTLLSSTRRAFAWGYTHYLVFAAVAAVGAGLSAAADAVTEHPALGPRGVAWAVAIPVAIYVLCLWILMDRGHGRPFARAPGPVVAAVVLLTPLGPLPLLTMGLVSAVYVAVKVRG